MAVCFLFTRTGLHFPKEWALFRVTSTSVILKDDLMCGSRRSPMVTGERLPCSTLSFLMSLKLLNLVTLAGTPQPMGSYALFRGLIFFIKKTHDPSADTDILGTIPTSPCRIFCSIFHLVSRTSFQFFRFFLQLSKVNTIVL